MAADPAEQTLPLGDSETDPPGPHRRDGEAVSGAPAAASCDGAATDDAEPAICYTCGYVGDPAGCTFGRPACVAEYCPSCRTGRECHCEESSDEEDDTHPTDVGAAALGALQSIAPRLRCTECGEGYRNPACDFTPPRCDAWHCSMGGPPCYGGEDCTCTDISDGGKRRWLTRWLLRTCPVDGDGGGSHVAAARAASSGVGPGGGDSRCASIGAEPSQSTSVGGDEAGSGAATQQTGAELHSGERLHPYPPQCQPPPHARS